MGGGDKKPEMKFENEQPTKLDSEQKLKTSGEHFVNMIGKV